MLLNAFGDARAAGPTAPRCPGRSGARQPARADGAASLAGVRAGETVVIESILFGSLRAFCADLGLHSGDEVRCRASGPGFLFLEERDGRVVSLERDWARFVAVHRAGPAAAR